VFVVSKRIAARPMDADGSVLERHVRPLCHEELPALLALYKHLHSDDEPPPTLEAAEAAWSEALANPRCRYFGGYAQGILVSSCTIMVMPNLTRGCRPYALIENVVTHQDHRNQGWGKAVLKHALDWAWAGKCYKVMLMTGRMEEPVFNFYEAAGFSRHGKQAFVAHAEA
jgi:GNAT superfamily N-acetyltransferase